MTQYPYLASIHRHSTAQFSLTLITLNKRQRPCQLNLHLPVMVVCRKGRRGQIHAKRLPALPAVTIPHSPVMAIFLNLSPEPCPIAIPLAHYHPLYSFYTHHPRPHLCQQCHQYVDSNAYTSLRCFRFACQYYTTSYDLRIDNGAVDCFRLVVSGN